MTARTAVAQRTVVEEIEVEFDFEAIEATPPRPGARPELAFDFSGKRARAAQGMARREETSTIKEAIVRWLEEQL